MGSLLSVFDPVSWIFMVSWATFLMPFYIIIFGFFIKSSFVSSVYLNVIEYLECDSKEQLTPLKYMTKMWILVSIFFMILFFNWFGLMPYVFSYTSHLMITLSLSLPLWVGLFSYSIFNFGSIFMAHLTPQGTPIFLTPLMVIIETVSMMIRPGVLSLRLMANITSGHIIMGLVASSGMMFIPLILLIVMEVLVGFIQAYVFMMLMSMYLGECE